MRFFRNSIKLLFLVYPSVASAADPGLPLLSKMLTTPPEAVMESAFDLPAWRGQGDFSGTRRKLLAEVTHAPPASQDISWLGLARFYFAQGLAAESMGALKQMHGGGAEKARDVLSLRAAAAFFANDTAQAEALLALPPLQNILEIRLLHGLAAARREQAKTAVRYLSGALPVIADYPSPWREKIAIQVAQAFLAVHDPDSAKDFIDVARPTSNSLLRDWVTYLDAQRAEQKSDHAKAETLRASLGETLDPELRTRVRFDLIEDKLTSHRISAGEAIDRLEMLAMQWHGDQLEYRLLVRLASLCFSSDRIKEGIAAGRAAVKRFPHEADQVRLAEMMSGALRGLIAAPQKSAAGPVALLALYQDNRDLLPADDPDIADQLADMLVRADLLDDAEDILKNALADTSAGSARGRLGAKIATIRLRQHHWPAALAALAETNVADLNADLQAARSRLAAQAYIEGGQPAEAVRALVSDHSPAADEIRVAAAWRMRSWSDATAILAGMIARDEQRRTSDKSFRLLLLRDAIALNLAGDSDGLAALRKKYTADFLADSYGKAFVLFTSPASEIGIAAKMRSAQELLDFVALHKELALAP
ncbi:MAG TPA: hypothetical protein VHL08_10745 [Dongiaceae bacterium]|jgi:hypothetical protein|nr:hypothetical protein [Dongiaceae bacterium]